MLLKNGKIIKITLLKPLRSLQNLQKVSTTLLKATRGLKENVIV